MSGNSSKKDVKKTPTTKGKETVKCSVCDIELRKDEMKNTGKISTSIWEASLHGNISLPEPLN
mgnify:CR=1 FL=1